MRVQVLVATMDQSDFNLLEKMNIKSDVIVGNQCSRNSIEEFVWNNHKVKYLNFAERGVGLNRNNCLMRADADICLFADDDIVYSDDYVEKVIKSFKEHPNADVIIFNLIEQKTSRYIIKKTEKVGYLNYLRYGTARIAVKLKSIREKGIGFNLCFGGGTEHCHGEDNLFLTDCLKKGLKVFAVPEAIAELTNARPSTWNSGYDEKYLCDQGYLFRAISKRWWILLCFQDALRRHKSYKMSLSRALGLMIRFPSRNFDQKLNHSKKN